MFFAQQGQDSNLHDRFCMICQVIFSVLRCNIYPTLKRLPSSNINPVVDSNHIIFTTRTGLLTFRHLTNTTIIFLAVIVPHLPLVYVTDKNLTSHNESSIYFTHNFSSQDRIRTCVRGGVCHYLCAIQLRHLTIYRFYLVPFVFLRTFRTLR